MVVADVPSPYAWYQSLTPTRGPAAGTLAGAIREHSSRAAENGSAWVTTSTTVAAAIRRAGPSSGDPPLRRSSHNVVPVPSTVQPQKAAGPTRTPMPWVPPVSGSWASQYHGSSRSGRTGCHPRSPYPRSHASPSTKPVTGRWDHRSPTRASGPPSVVTVTVSPAGASSHDTVTPNAAACPARTGTGRTGPPVPFETATRSGTPTLTGRDRSAGRAAGGSPGGVPSRGQYFAALERL